MSPSPEPWAVVALFWHPSQDGSLLSISRRNLPDDIGLPGGKIDPGETPEEALIRECREEVGVTIEPDDVEPIYDREDQTVGRIARCFLVRKWTGHPRAMENGFKVRWVTIDDLLRQGNTFADYNRGLLRHLGVMG